eukprot:174558-Prymnesium_polylepis.1
MAAAPLASRPPAHVTPHNVVHTRRTRGARRLRPTPDALRQLRLPPSGGGGVAAAAAEGETAVAVLSAAR